MKNNRKAHVGEETADLVRVHDAETGFSKDDTGNNIEWYCGN